jgi:PAS domain S-box-containing protein
MEHGDVESFCHRLEAAHAASMTHETRSHQWPERLARAVGELDWAWRELSVAREELQQQNDELIESQRLLEAERQRYQELFDLALDPSLVTDAHGMIRMANRAAASLLGIPAPVLRGKALISFISIENRASFRQTLLRLPQVRHIREWDVRVQPRQLPRVSARVSAGLLPAPAGGTPEVLWSMRDTSERVRLESELRERLDDVRRFSESQT